METLSDPRDRPCPQCKAIHGDIRTLVKADKACPKCRGPRHSHTLNPCAPTRAAYLMCKRGLISTRRWRRQGSISPLVTPANHAAAMLRMLGHKCWLVRSNYISGGEPARECWTTADGIDTLACIQHAARVCIGGSSISNPMVARLFKDNPTVFAEFRTLWKMDASTETLRHELITALTPLDGRPKREKPNLRAIRGRARRAR